jgi:hypothetical protein
VQAVGDIKVYTDIPAMSSVHDAEALDKPRVVVLGSGWAAASFMKALPKDIKCVAGCWWWWWAASWPVAVR